MTQSQSNIFSFMKQLLRRTKGPQNAGPLKWRRYLFEESITSSSSISTEETTVEKRVRIYPIVQVKEITKYTEDEVKSLFYSHDSLRKIREREKVCFMFQFCSNHAVNKLVMTPFSLADKEDLECKAGLRSIEDTQSRAIMRKQVIVAVIVEQNFNRESLGTWDAVWAPEQCKHHNTLASTQAIERAIEAEREAVEIYGEELQQRGSSAAFKHIKHNI